LVHSPPIGAPFSATERFISKTENATESITTANSQRQSKYASADACWWRRFSSACHASCCAAAESRVCWRKRAYAVLYGASTSLPGLLFRPLSERNFSASA
jgi:hypothetical protein